MIDSKACYDCRNGSCPEHGVTRVLFVEPFYRKEYSEAEKAHFEKLAAFTKPADVLLDDAWTDRNEEHDPPQLACSRCGGPQNVLLTPYGWTCDHCLEGDTMPDYEALGYPETACGNARLDEIAWLVGFLQRAHKAISGKDIRVATDIVDSAD